MESSQTRQCLMNSKQTVVDQAIEGLCQAYPHIVRLKGSRVVTLRTLNPSKVSLICGGGSGHEPAHAGFVDEKLLTASVNGNVFASPPIEEIQMAIHHVASASKKSQGVLVIIKNYTGDVINFELAAQYARAQGIQVRTLTVADDIAFIDENPLYRQQARGLTGTVMLYKILGAAAYAGAELESLVELGEDVLCNVATFGLSFGACSLPGFGANFSIPDGEIEYGLGIHGEKGLKRAPLDNSAQIAEKVFAQFSQRFSAEQLKEIALIVNNLGGATDLEMAVFSKDILAQFEGSVVRALAVGKFMSSLEMHGVSVTVLSLSSSKFKDSIIKHLLEPNTQGVALKFIEPSLFSGKGDNLWQVECVDSPFQNDLNFLVQREYSEALLQIQVKAKKFFEKLKEKQEMLNKLDSVVGDGDTGSGVAFACTAVLKELNLLDFQLKLSGSLRKIGRVVARSFGGTSGPLYGAFLDAIGQRLKTQVDDNKTLDYLDAFELGVKSIEQIGKAQVGERTMIDVLRPVSDALKKQFYQENKEIAFLDLFKFALGVAKENSEKAASLKALKGRARYFGGTQVGHIDPGCQLVCEWLSILTDINIPSAK